MILDKKRVPFISTRFFYAFNNFKHFTTVHMSITAITSFLIESKAFDTLVIILTIL